MYVICIFGIKHVKKKWMGVITEEKGITNVTKTWAIDNRILNNAACSEISGYLGPDQLYEEHSFTHIFVGRESFAACSEISGFLGPDQLYAEHRFTHFFLKISFAACSGISGTRSIICRTQIYTLLFVRYFYLKHQKYAIEKRIWKKFVVLG